MAVNPSADLGSQRVLITALRTTLPGASPAAPATLIETHISWVLLAGGLAYKLKKAVDLGFLDFTTLAARRHFCDEELRLNRRLAPDIYLDVVAIHGTPDAPILDGEGPAIEFAVKMREFPQDALASHALARGELANAHFDALAADIAAFHGSIAVAPADGEFGRPEDILQAALTNFAVIRLTADDPAERAELDALRDWTEREFAARAAMFERRRQQGFVRECHGDLHLGNMVLQDARLVVFDCIEFNPRLRWIDVISEVAFTVMDLVDRGSPALAHRFLNDYLELTGDYAGLALLWFYLVYRAMVRAKVMRLRIAQIAPGADEAALLAEYRGYLDLARRFSRPPRPALVITHGLSGCGKTTLSGLLLEATGAVRIRTDVERKRLHGLKPEQRSGSGLAGGLYAAAATQETYAEVAALARAVVLAGEIAIVDATCLARWQRDLFRRLAAELAVPFVIVSFTASVATLRERLARRSRTGGGASEADVAVLEHQLATQQPLAADELPDVVTWDTETLRPDDPAAWQPILARLGLERALA